MNADESQITIDTPVAFFIFNRPEKTERVFEQIAAAEPPALYVVADGPRPDVADDPTLCKQTRKVVEDPDWDCQTHRNYADENLGVCERISTGIEWVFRHEREAILLEDDCLPHLHFFPFCEQMLEQYRGDERVMDVTGTNAISKWKDDRQDYHFSYHGIIWGWATWREAWDNYDPEMKLWDDSEVRGRIRDVLADDAQYRYTERVYNKTYTGELDTWDYQWGFARQRNSGLSVVPSRNLVTNIGFDTGTVHKNAEGDPRANLPLFGLDFPIEQNQFVAPDRGYDQRYHKLRAPFWYNCALLVSLRDYIIKLNRRVGMNQFK